MLWRKFNGDTLKLPIKMRRKAPLKEKRQKATGLKFVLEPTAR